jgi:hypothetical protein
MQLNYRKTIVDQIDAAIAASVRKVESVTLTKDERAEFYRTAGSRFYRRAYAGRPSVRGLFQQANGQWIEVIAAGE